MAKIFLEVIVSPSFSKEALEILTKKKNLRLLQLDHIDQKNRKASKAKTVLGGLLIQDSDTQLLHESELKVVTKRQPTEAEMRDLLFAWKVVKHTKSNGIAIAKDLCTTGVGPGQVSRIWALENAIRQGRSCSPSRYYSYHTAWRIGQRPGVYRCCEQIRYRYDFHRHETF